MGILDNDTIIVDAILTKLGRNKLRQGQPLGITQYAFGDTGVDYNLYNPDHPSGSDAYGAAITNLPQLEAVPDDDVFLRSRLYGTGERGIQNFGFIDLPDGVKRTIQHIPQGIQSTAVVLRPRVFSAGSAQARKKLEREGSGSRSKKLDQTAAKGHPEPKRQKTFKTRPKTKVLSMVFGHLQK